MEKFYVGSLFGKRFRQKLTPTTLLPILTNSIILWDNWSRTYSSLWLVSLRPTKIILCSSIYSKSVSAVFPRLQRRTCELSIIFRNRKDILKVFVIFTIPWNHTFVDWKLWAKPPTPITIYLFVFCWTSFLVKYGKIWLVNTIRMNGHWSSCVKL